jgi:hypothetical protein
LLPPPPPSPIFTYVPIPNSLCLPHLLFTNHRRPNIPLLAVPPSPSTICSDAHEWASRGRVESSVVREGGALASAGEWRRVASRTVAQRKTSGVKGRVSSRTVEARSSVARQKNTREAECLGEDTRLVCITDYMCVAFVLVPRRMSRSGCIPISLNSKAEIFYVMLVQLVNRGSLINEIKIDFSISIKSHLRNPEIWRTVPVSSLTSGYLIILSTTAKHKPYRRYDGVQRVERGSRRPGAGSGRE